MGPISHNMALSSQKVRLKELRDLFVGSGVEIYLADAVNIHAQLNSVEIVRLKDRRFDCRSVNGCKETSR